MKISALMKYCEIEVWYYMHVIFFSLIGNFEFLSKRNFKAKVIYF